MRTHVHPATLSSPILLSLSLSFFFVVDVVEAHVGLTFPPARNFDLDFLDNIRTKAPCGMPKGKTKTLLQSGVPLNISWHLSYPHRGGYRLELLDKNDKFLLDLISRTTNSTDYMSGDPTAQWKTVTIPQELRCDDCSIRLLRQASEWANSYRFWSCADVRIVGREEFSEDCMGHGSPVTGGCRCHKGFWGPRCQFEEECLSDSDCGKGTCVDLGGTALPQRQCFCPPGLHGEKCTKRNQAELPTQSTLDLSTYKKEELSKSMAMYFKVVGEEMEFVLEVQGTSYGAVGWRPGSFNKSCKLWPHVEEVPRARSTREAAARRRDYIPNETLLRPVSVLERSRAEPEPSGKGGVGGHGGHLVARGRPAKTQMKSEPTKQSSTPHAEPEAEAEPKPESESEPKPEAEAEPKPEAEAEPKPEVEPEPESPKPEADSEPKPQSGKLGTTIPKSQAEPEPEASSEPKPEAESEPKPEAESEPKPETPPKSEPESEPHPESETEPKPEAESEPHPESEPKSQPKAEPRPAAAAAEPESHSEPKPESESEPHPESESEAESEPKPEGQAESEPQSSGANGDSPHSFRSSSNGLTPSNERFTWETRSSPYSPKGDFHAMDCTDIVLGAARGVYSRILDYYTRDRSTPRLDSFWGGTNSLTSATGWESNGKTLLVFRKPLASSEPTDHGINGVMHVIWARGQEPGAYVHSPASGLERESPSVPQFYAEDEVKYHGHRGQRGVAFVDFQV